MANIFKKLLGKLKKEEESTATPVPVESKQEIAYAQSDMSKASDKTTAVKAEEQPPKAQPNAPVAKAEPKKPASQADTPTPPRKG